MASVVPSSGTYFSAKCRRITSPRGPVKTVVIIEHALLVVVCNVFATGDTYVDSRGDHFTKR